VKPLPHWTQEIRKLSYFCAEMKNSPSFLATSARIYKEVVFYTYYG